LELRTPSRLQETNRKSFRVGGAPVISFHTISFHLKNIYEKLQVHSKTEAVAKALREHLV